MGKLKMGISNRITLKRFNEIKSSIDDLTDKQVMERYNIRTTTLKYIKKSKNFYEYRLLTETIPAARKMPTVIEPTSGVEYEDFSCKGYRNKPPKLERSMMRDDRHTANMFGTVLLVGLIVLGIVAIVVVALATGQLDGQ